MWCTIIREVKPTKIVFCKKINLKYYNTKQAFGVQIPIIMKQKKSNACDRESQINSLKPSLTYEKNLAKEALC